MSTLSACPWRELKVTGLLELLTIETLEHDTKEKTKNKIIKNFGIVTSKFYSTFFYDRRYLELSLEKHLVDPKRHLSFESPKRALKIFDKSVTII